MSVQGLSVTGMDVLVCGAWTEDSAKIHGDMAVSGGSISEVPFGETSGAVGFNGVGKSITAKTSV